tara:strand:- start:10202 stop:10933 length:732 start_codon:yes stop_codon:yes gene_type:complete
MIKQLMMALCIVGALSSCSKDTQQSKDAEQIEQLKARVAKLENIQTAVAQRVGLGALVRPDTIEFGDGHLIGSEQAEVVVIEFTDLHCPFCAKFHSEVWPQLKADYIDSDKVLFVGRELPLIKLHPNAGYAAVSLRCAAKQDQYSAAKDSLFNSSQTFDNEYLAELMTELNLDTEKMSACLQNMDVHNGISTSLNYATSLGFNGTPVFVVGRRQGNTVTDYEIVTGASTVESFSDLFERYLSN